MINMWLIQQISWLFTSQPHLFNSWELPLVSVTEWSTLQWVAVSVTGFTGTFQRMFGWQTICPLLNLSRASSFFYFNHFIMFYSMSCLLFPLFLFRYLGSIVLLFPIVCLQFCNYLTCKSPCNCDLKGAIQIKFCIIIRQGSCVHTARFIPRGQLQGAVPRH